MSVDTQNVPKNAPSLVPTGVSVGLFLGCVAFSLAGFLFRALVEPIGSFVWQMLATVLFFSVIAPCLILVGAYGMNKFGSANIHPKNAITLGLLLSFVGLVCMMGVYS